MFGPPGFLQGDEVRAGITTTGPYVGHLDASAESFIQAHHAESIAIETTYPFVGLARVVAKIGYGYAVGELGLPNVVDPLVVPAILGEAEDIGHWVGTVGDQALPGPVDALHAASVFEERGVIVAVQLFCVQPAPLYMVLVSKHPPPVTQGLARSATV